MAGHKGLILVTGQLQKVYRLTCFERISDIRRCLSSTLHQTPVPEQRGNCQMFLSRFWERSLGHTHLHSAAVSEDPQSDGDNPIVCSEACNILAHAE